MITAPGNAEWLEADKLGGFASGTVSGVGTRRYHALLLSAGEAWGGTTSGTSALSSHRYQPGVTHPDGSTRIEEFGRDPWPRWVFRLEDGRRVEHQLLVPH
ncbi:MAG TPA: glycogen debranching enzyme N-terminal domain-containing protein [Candidatus Polarisedimenticolia bacterium]|nr:glycogen debranching enzyme N-terminal domain-containing protein [Candidatus Polarisedimenticolia bacterium]